MWEQSQYVFFSILDHRRVLNQIPQDVSDITFCSTNQYFMVKKLFQPIYGQTLDHKQTKASLQSRADSRAEWKIVSPLEVCKWGMERGRKSGISNIPFTGWKLGWREMAAPRESQQLAIILTTCPHQSLAFVDQATWCHYSFHAFL